MPLNIDDITLFTSKHDSAGDFVKGDAASKGVRWQKWTALLNDNFEWFGHLKMNIVNGDYFVPDYFFFLESFKVDRARCKWTGRSAVEVNIKNEIFTVVSSHYR